MNGWGNLAIRVYRVLLAFYPSGFRAEFGEEMQEVFSAALKEVQHPSRKHTWWLFWQEIRDWPGVVLREHIQARREKMSANGFIDGEPLPRRELLAAMIVFLLPLTSFLTTGYSLPLWMDYLLLIVVWGALLFALGLALIKGLPRWSLPYLGVVLMCGAIFSRYDRIWSGIYPYFIQSFGPRSYWPLLIQIFYSGIFAFILLFTILLGAMILVNLLRLFPYTCGVWVRIRTDWTQLSYMFFGGLVVVVLIAFEEYQHDDIWKLVVWLWLALGAWLYLRVNGQKQRILILIGGATGALWTVALAKWVLIPLQKWPTGYPVAPTEATRWVETGDALIGWVLILALLMAPALLNYLPKTPSSLEPEEESPVTA